MRSDHWLAFTLALALGVGRAPGALAGTVETTETTETTTTTYAGTVTEVTPSSTIIVRSRADEAPRAYTYSKKTIFLDPSGRVVSADLIRGHPVTIYYHPQGDGLVVTKVIVSKPVVAETTTEIHREIR